jgi:hypothetical protein
MDRAADIIPTIRLHLSEQTIIVATAGRSEQERSGSGHSDPTQRLALELATIDAHQRQIDDALERITTAIDLLDDACRRALGKRAPTQPTPDEPMCHWAGCSDPVSSYRRDDGSHGYRMGGDYGGMCDRHRSQARREATT